MCEIMSLYEALEHNRHTQNMDKDCNFLRAVYISDSAFEFLELFPNLVVSETCVCARHFSRVCLLVTLWTYGPPDSSVHGIL